MIVTLTSLTNKVYKFYDVVNIRHESEHSYRLTVRTDGNPNGLHYDYRNTLCKDIRSMQATYESEMP